MSKTSRLIGVVLAVFIPTLAFAATPGLTGNPIADGILSTVIYSLIGIVMAFVAFKVIDILTPGHLSKAIADNNIALALIAGMMMLGVCIIIAAVLAS